jgi:SAM-dependent methyltransferase
MIDYMLCETCHGIVSENFRCACNFPNFVTTTPIALSLHEAYKDLYRRIAEIDVETSIQDSRHLMDKAYDDYRILSKFGTKKQLKDLCILEVGPGLGHLARLLSPENDYHATDIIDTYLDSRQKSFTSNLEFLPPFLHEKFDLVIVCDVLEHVLNEGNAWMSLVNALKEGGRLYVRVPCNEPLLNYANDFGSEWPIVHLRTYNRRILRNTIGFLGLKVIRFGRSGNSAADWLSRIERLERFWKKKRTLTSQERSSFEHLAGVQREWDVNSRSISLSRWLRKHLPPSYFRYIYKVAVRTLYRPAEVWVVAEKRAL